MTAAAGGDVVRVLPPLNISQRDIEVAEARLDLAAAAWTAQSTT
jgi:acetylornithine/succinyldiaminopimelate/putrescine aminotransferase